MFGYLEAGALDAKARTAMLKQGLQRLLLIKIRNQDVEVNCVGHQPSIPAAKIVPRSIPFFHCVSLG